MVALDKIELPLRGQKEVDGPSDQNSYQQTATAAVDVVNMKNRKNVCANLQSISCDESSGGGGGGCGVNGGEVASLPTPVSPCANKSVEISSNNNNCKGHERRRNFIVQYFKKKSQSWSRDQFVTILILSFVEFFAAAVISIQAPFYPDVARDKGASATEYGIVFGIFEITVFIMSPIYGAKMDYLKPRRVFNWGILTTGTCCVIFGLLDTIEGRGPFIWSCLLVRTIEAMGDAAFDTASFTIIAMEFPDSVGTSFSILEICFGLGLIIGPTLGGVLFEIGGYRLPFLAMGGFLFVAAILTYVFLPEPSQRHQQQRNVVDAAGGPGEISQQPVARGGFHMFRMLKIPVIAMTAYSIVAATAGVGFISANLDTHLDQFNLNKVAVGAVFVMNGGVYAVTAPVWGWICDHTDYQKTITLTGAIFTILGFIFIGPVPGFPQGTTLPVSCLGLALFGFGLAATLVSAFLQVLNDAIAQGYPDDISTYGLVSGLWTSMSALGYFIGPTAGGVAVDLMGFRWSSLFVIGAQLILIIMLFAYYMSRGRRSLQISQPEDDPATAKREEIAKPGNFVALPCSLTVASEGNGDVKKEDASVATANKAEPYK